VRLLVYLVSLPPGAGAIRHAIANATTIVSTNRIHVDVPNWLFVSSFLELIFFFLSNVTALNITVQPHTIVGQTSLVLWAREPSDGNGLLVFDLRFVKPDNEDVGLALANIQAPPSTEYGTAQVVFPSSG
jgi:hypothetical protein